MSIVWIHKPIGWTPKACIDEYRSVTGEKGKIAFAGRLDPMAYGLLPIVVNGTRDTASLLESSDKTYQFKVILGLQTDTYDILGLVTNIHEDNILDELQLQRMVETYSKVTTQEYPPYSSKTVTDERTGKKVQLWKLTTEGMQVELPEHDIEIKYIKLLTHTTVSFSHLLMEIILRLESLSPSIHMRQDMISTMWKYHENKMKNRSFQIIECEANVSTGTYIRSIANSMNGVCYDINRIQYGDQNLPVGIDKLSFAIL